MEELKVLVGMVAELPSMALWVVAFFFAYKVVVVGSIYGVIRLAIVKLHSVLTKERVVITKTEPITDGQLCAINKVVGEGLSHALARLSSVGYLHGSDIKRVNRAIDLLLAEEQAASSK